MAVISRSAAASTASGDHKLPFVIVASSIGTIIEWYDFYLYAVLDRVPGAAVLPAATTRPRRCWPRFATFGAGFAVRPFGAVVFGRIGDLVGRKYAFLVTVTIMGLGTTVIGLLPGYASIGVLAPIILVLLRLAQGLALGGEYGGAAIYVAEHAPDDRRGYYTALDPDDGHDRPVPGAARHPASAASASAARCSPPGAGACRSCSRRSWSSWRCTSACGCRRRRCSPRLKAAGQASTSPIKDSLGNSRNWRLILLALFGATAGQAVVWYQGQFQALFFLEGTLKVDFVTGDLIMIVALLLGTPFFLVFGALSDRIGRKPIIMAGCLLAAVTYYPIYLLMGQFTAEPVHRRACSSGSR